MQKFPYVLLAKLYLESCDTTFTNHNQKLTCYLRRNAMCWAFSGKLKAFLKKLNYGSKITLHWNETCPNTYKRRKWAAKQFYNQLTALGLQRAGRYTLSKKLHGIEAWAHCFVKRDSDWRSQPEDDSIMKMFTNFFLYCKERIFYG